MNVPKLLKIDPPIHVRYFRYAGPTTLILVPKGTKDVNYLLNLSGVPANMVDPPLKTMFVYRSFLTSKSHFIIDWYTI